MLIAASWDNTVSAYQVDTSVGVDQRTQVTAMTPKMQIKHEAPALSCVVEGTTVYSGGCDRNVKLWDVTKGATATTIGQHEAPVRQVRIVPGMNVVASGGWDSAVKVWDPRQPSGTAAAQAKLTERVFAMDASANTLVVGTADRGIHVFDLRSGLTNKLAAYESPCKVTVHSRRSFRGVQLGSASSLYV
jgi:mRNA export factor